MPRGIPGWKHLISGSRSSQCSWFSFFRAAAHCWYGISSPSTTPSPAGTQPSAPSGITGAADTTVLGRRPGCATIGRAWCVRRSQFAVLLASQIPLKSGLPAMRPPVSGPAAPAGVTLRTATENTIAITTAAVAAMRQLLPKRFIVILLLHIARGGPVLAHRFYQARGRAIAPGLGTHGGAAAEYDAASSSRMELRANLSRWSDQSHKAYYMEDCLQSSEGTARSSLARVMVSGFVGTDVRQAADGIEQRRHQIR